MLILVIGLVATCNGFTGKLSVEINENKFTNTEAIYNPVNSWRRGKNKEIGN